MAIRTYVWPPNTVSISGGATLAEQQNQSDLIGSKTETAPASDTASSGLNGRLQRIAQRLTSLIALLPTSLGQKTSASSLAVVIASDQSAIAATVSGVATAANQSAEQTLVGAVTETAPATDTASSGLNGRLQRIAQRLTSLIALVPASLGQKASASAFAVTLSSEQEAEIGTVTETAPASDTASSGLNGRLQRIAQRLTSLIALVPSSLGAKTGANSFSVVPASDATFALQKSATATLSNVASSASNVTLLASNSSRIGAFIYNDSTQILYIKFGAAASATSYTVQVSAGGFYEIPTPPVYTGIIDGIWASANGNARITELT